MLLDLKTDRAQPNSRRHDYRHAHIFICIRQETSYGCVGVRTILRQAPFIFCRYLPNSVQLTEWGFLRI